MTSGKRTPEHILRQIRRLRKETQLSMPEIARATGVSVSVVNHALISLPGDVDVDHTVPKDESTLTSDADVEALKEGDSGLPDNLDEDDGISEYGSPETI